MEVVRMYKKYDTFKMWLDKQEMERKGFTIIRREEGITQRSWVKTGILGLIFLPLALFGTNSMVKITYYREGEK